MKNSGLANCCGFPLLFVIPMWCGFAEIWYFQCLGFDFPVFCLLMLPQFTLKLMWVFFFPRVFTDYSKCSPAGFWSELKLTVIHRICLSLHTLLSQMFVLWLVPFSNYFLIIFWNTFCLTNFSPNQTVHFFPLHPQWFPQTQCYLFLVESDLYMNLFQIGVAFCCLFFLSYKSTCAVLCVDTQCKVRRVQLIFHVHAPKLLSGVTTKSQVDDWKFRAMQTEPPWPKQCDRPPTAPRADNFLISQPGCGKQMHENIWISPNDISDKHGKKPKLGCWSCL